MDPRTKSRVITHITHQVVRDGNDRVVHESCAYSDRSRTDAVLGKFRGSFTLVPGKGDSSCLEKAVADAEAKYRERLVIVEVDNPKEGFSGTLPGYCRLFLFYHPGSEANREFLAFKKD